MIRKCFTILWGLSMVAALLLAGQLGTVSARPVSSMIVPNLDIILVIDESDTMWKLNDSDGWRVFTAKLFGDLMGVDQSGSEHQLGLVMFGNDVELALPLSRIDTESARIAYRAAIDTDHTNMGGTNIAEAINVAINELDNHGRSGAKQAIIFLTDGHCEIQGQGPGGTKECNEQTRRLVTETDKQIYTIAFTEMASRQDEESKIYKNLLQEIASLTGGLYFEPAANERELQDAYIAIMQDLFGIPNTKLPNPVQSPMKVKFTLSPGLYQVIFTIIKSSYGIDTKIIDPNGVTIDQGDPMVRFSTTGRSDVYSVREPLRGEWTVEISGKGSATILPIPFPKGNYSVEREAPEGSHPAGKPLNYIVRVVDNDGEVQEADNLRAEVLLPDISVRELPFRPLGEGYYRADFTETTQLGTYKFSFLSDPEAEGGPKVEGSDIIEVINAPWLNILQPMEGGSLPASSAAEVVAQLMMGTGAVTHPDDTESLTVHAVITSELLSAPEERDLLLASSGMYRGVFDLQTQGTYWLQVALSYVLSNQEAFIDTTEFTFIVGQPAPPVAKPIDTFTPTVTPTHTSIPMTPTTTLTPSPTPTPAPPPPPPSARAVAGMVGGGLGLLGLIGASFWWMQKPALVGSLVDSSGSTMLLAGKGARIFGSSPKSSLVSYDQGVAAEHAVFRPIGSKKNPMVEISAIDPNMYPVLVDDLPLTGPHILTHGEKITIGNQTFTYEGMPKTEFGDLPPADFGSSDPNNPFS